MPELPEIETIKRVIEPQIQGLGIEQIHVSRPEVVAHPAADEFCSRLRGQIFDSVTCRGKFLAGEDWERLSETIPERLSFFIRKNEIAPEEYLETKRRDYRNTPFLQVYGHEGKPCPICGESLCRMVIGGRSSIYCPRCQPR